MPPEHDEQVNQELGCFRAYLETLSHVRIDPRLRAAFGFSDVVQKTLWKAFQALDKLRLMNDSGQKRYLRRMLENTLLDQIREVTAAKRDCRLDRSLEVLAAKSSCRLR